VSGDGPNCEVRPNLRACCPLPYLRWVVQDSMTLAMSFRFDLAPGYFKQVDIARVLADMRLGAMDRRQHLTRPRYGDAWLEARAFDGRVEWRPAFWKEPA